MEKSKTKFLPLLGAAFLLLGCGSGQAQSASSPAGDPSSAKSSASSYSYSIPTKSSTIPHTSVPPAGDKRAFYNSYEGPAAVKEWGELTPNVYLDEGLSYPDGSLDAGAPFSLRLSLANLYWGSNESGVKTLLLGTEEEPGYGVDSIDIQILSESGRPSLITERVSGEDFAKKENGIDRPNAASATESDFSLSYEFDLASLCPTDFSGQLSLAITYHGMDFHAGEGREEMDCSSCFLFYYIHDEQGAYLTSLDYASFYPFDL